MSSNTNTIARLLMILMLVLPWSLSPAQAASSSFQVSGEILELTRNTINVSDHYFAVIATVKVSIPGKKNAKLKNLKKGDLVRVKVRKYNDKLYVDTIDYLKELPSNQL